MNPYATESHPRLSSRLVWKLYGEVVATPEELIVKKSLIKQTPKAGLNESNKKLPVKADFNITRFLPNNHTFAVAEANGIRQHYREFIAIIGSLAPSNSPLHKNAANTMYNIITRINSMDMAYKDALSYFGFIDRKIFEDAVNHAIALAAIENGHNSTNGDSHTNPALNSSGLFKLDFNYDEPKLFLIDGDNDDNEQESNSSIAINSKTSPDESVLLWLTTAADAYIKTHQSLLNVVQFCTEVVTICRASKSDEDLQMKLFELVGESDIEFLFGIVQRANEIKRLDLTEIADNKKRDSSTTLLASKENPINPPAEITQTKETVPWENMSANQRKKMQIREQKEMEAALRASQEEDVSKDWLARLGFNEEYLLQERALGLQKNRTMESWTENLAAEGTREYHEQRGLPAGTKKTYGDGFEEVFIPAAPRPPSPREGELISISVLEPWAQTAFKGTTSLNRIQSKVFSCAYYSSENMLVCAPTGAGKTNIAMLTLLQLMRQYMSADGVFDKTGFKAIYIAPMKALAQEVTAKFSERLKPLGVVVKEYTGLCIFIQFLLIKQINSGSGIIYCR